MTRAAILNSRHSKTPIGNDPWVRATVAAVKFAAANDWSIVSSFGLNTWELVTWAAGREKVPLTLLYPEDLSETSRDDLLRRFNLSRDLIEWIPVTRGERRSTIKNWWEHRDAAVISLADRLLPVGVRKGGRIDTLVQSAGRPVDEQFRVPYLKATHHGHVASDRGLINSDFSAWDDNWLIHWTRACHGPWPGETEAEFYLQLVESGDDYCHSAFATLQRILRESLIRGSAWKIGAKMPVVAFTELSPAESLSLMRWRPRWSRWSFEPYGIAIHKHAAESLGVRMVNYVGSSDWRKIPESDKPLSHSKGKHMDVWPAEREWRKVGDVGLNQIQPEHIRIITRTRAESAELASKFRNHIFSFESA
jgi:hypothetical protein